MTCKTCRWWETGVCDFVNSEQAEKAATRFEIVVRVADDHDLEVTLRTGPDFGCIHHTAK